MRRETEWVNVRWKHKSENFKSLDSAKDWADRHDGARVFRWNGFDWVKVYESKKKGEVGSVNGEKN